MDDEPVESGRVGQLDNASGQEGVDDPDQLLGGPGARIVPRRLRVDDVLADMAFDDLGDEAVEGAAAGGRLLQHGRAAGLLLERALDGIELAADPPDPVEQFLLVPQSVCHFSLDPILQGSIYAEASAVEPVHAGVLVQPVQGIR
jgi:hypothetical protein